MFSIIGRLDKNNILVEGFVTDHIVSFKIGKGEDKKEMTIALTFSDGTKETLKGNEAEVFFKEVLTRAPFVSLNASPMGNANKMLSQMQTQITGARVKAKKEADDQAKAVASRPFKQVM